jgi:hypothetical protein
MLRRIAVCIPLGLALVCAEALGPTAPANPTDTEPPAVRGVPLSGDDDRDHDR